MKKIMTMLAILFMVSSCTTIKEVPVEVVKTKYQTEYVYDSVRLWDSIYIDRKGDTIWIEKFKEVYKEKIVKDTLIVRDTIETPVYIDKVKEVNNPSKFQRFLSFTGALSIFSFLLYLLYLVKFKQRK